MFSSVLILIVSTALVLFYLQATCETILRRRFEEPLADPVIEANGLNFLSIRKNLERFGTPADCQRLQMELKSDYSALVHLLRNAANRHRRLSRTDWVLACYFRALSSALTISHLARIPEKGILLRMTTVLEYFSKVFGERIKTVRFGSATASL